MRCQNLNAVQLRLISCLTQHHRSLGENDILTAPNIWAKSHAGAILLRFSEVVLTVTGCWWVLEINSLGQDKEGEENTAEAATKAEQQAKEHSGRACRFIKATMGKHVDWKERWKGCENSMKRVLSDPTDSFF